jgi:penicillin-binding protein A
MSAAPATRAHRARESSARKERGQRARRAIPVIALAVTAFVIGAIVGANHSGSAQQSVAEQFVRAWTQNNYLTMYEDIDAAAQHAISPSAFATNYKAAERTATSMSMTITGGTHTESDGAIVVPVRVRTRVFGTLTESFRVPVREESGRSRVAWSDVLVFPGLRPGEQLSRHTALPPRAALLARNGSVLAEGPASSAGTRASSLGAAADAVVGEVGSIPASRVDELEAEGVPSNAIVGTSGLELALDNRLRGTPGGQLLAGTRVLASAVAKPSPAVRTTINPALQQVAATALGGQIGGVVAIDPSNGQILAVAGIGIDSVQPPGSTFKMVTVTAALESKVANEHTVFPYATSATLDGVTLENANGEDCGGSLALAFAVSCNSVFAPLGVRVGAARLVATAEALGFNHEPGLAGAAESSLPPASQIQGELELGSTAIGQGKVLASPLEMATVASTVADGGLRPTPTFQVISSVTPRPRAMSAATARTVRRLMIGVVREGTGTAAAIPGVTVAGKTGTAELGIPRCAGKGEKGSGEASGSESDPDPETGKGESAESKQSTEDCSTGPTDPQNTDAWFAAFAPALHPRVAVGVLLVKDGAGGETAAPVARQVIEAALESHEGI